MAKKPWYDPLRYDLTRYDVFERAMSAVLLVGMAIVIVYASVSFVVTLGQEAGRLGSHMGYETFQRLFDSALAVLIAIELSHSVLQSVRGHHGLVQVRTVVVIGVLAIVRKFVLLEIETAEGMLVLGLAAALASHGVVYAVTHWIEDRMRKRKREDDEVDENLSERAGVPTSESAS
ncbi:MAG: phosphate-starvation-inducible PsiE family protein [Paracoccaceae bacterium]